MASLAKSICCFGRSVCSTLASSSASALVRAPAFHNVFRSATKKSGGTSKNGRTSNPKFLGTKKHHDQPVIPGNIIIRQRGTKWYAGEGVGMGRDHTLYALVEGRVQYHYNKERKRRSVSVTNPELQALALARQEEEAQHIVTSLEQRAMGMGMMEKAAKRRLDAAPKRSRGRKPPAEASA